MEKLELESISDNKVEEAIKRLSVNLSSAYPEVKTVLVTSIAGKEGKSFVSCQLANVMARKGKKTIYINGDLRTGMSKQIGLVEYLKKETSLNKIVYDTGCEYLKVIPAGKTVLSIINEVLLEEMLKELKKNYDYIIIDSPSVGEVADAMSLGKICDGVLMVLELGVVEEKHIQKVKEEMERNGCKILGAVLNKVI